MDVHRQIKNDVYSELMMLLGCRLKLFGGIKQSFKMGLLFAYNFSLRVNQRLKNKNMKKREDLTSLFKYSVIKK